MTNSNDIKLDAESALSDVHKLRIELLEFAELSAIDPALRGLQLPISDDLQEFSSRVAGLLDRINNLLKRIRSSNTVASNEASAFSLSTLTNELNAQLDWLKGILEHLETMIKTSVGTLPEWFTNQVAAPVQSALQKIKTYLVPLLKRFLSKIWQIISNMLTPKEWKLQGKVGTGILGLADVGIEITFGP